MIATFCLPPTVLRSAAECPCTSALGLITRRYSAESSNDSPASNDTASLRPLSLSRISVGQGSFVILSTRSLQTSWPGLARPSTKRCSTPRHHARHEAGHDVRVSNLSQREIEIAELLDAGRDLVTGLQPDLLVLGIAVDHAIRCAGEDDVAGPHGHVSRDVADELLHPKDHQLRIRRLPHLTIEDAFD